MSKYVSHPGPIPVLLIYREGVCALLLFLRYNSLLSVNIQVTIVPRTCLVAADVMVIFVTWHATYRTNRTMRKALVRSLGSQGNLSSTLLRDGG